MIRSLSVLFLSSVLNFDLAPLLQLTVTDFIVREFFSSVVFSFHHVLGSTIQQFSNQPGLNFSVIQKVNCCLLPSFKKKIDKNKSSKFYRMYQLNNVQMFFFFF